MALGGSWLFFVVFVVNVVPLRFLVVLSGYWCFFVFIGSSWCFLVVHGGSWKLLVILGGS